MSSSDPILQHQLHQHRLLARCLANPSRFAGLHFFNPAHIMKIVEVIKGPRTSDDVVSTCVNSQGRPRQDSGCSCRRPRLHREPHRS
ncbi:MAG: hypothetical protein IPF79_02310 [Ignavibacteria bacterium]|nr:hypothetical protein [Ignavibacteria bacterium]